MKEWNLESGWPPSRATTNILLLLISVGHGHRQKMHLFLLLLPTSCTSGMSPRMGKWCPESRAPNDLYRRAKTQKLCRQATAFKPHLSRVMAAHPIAAWRVHGLSSRQGFGG